MKLSEAIRLGAMLGPQLYGRTRDDGLGSCALGAALLAIGDEGQLYTDAMGYWPLLMEPAPSVPEAIAKEFGESAPIILSVIRGLNDYSRWTREQIADWVETIEKEHAREVFPSQSVGSPAEPLALCPTAAHVVSLVSADSMVRT